MGTGITSALLTNFPYGGGTPPLQWLGFAIFVLNFILFIFVCGCTVARYVMFPEVRVQWIRSVLSLTPLISGLGTHVEPPCSKPIHRLFPYGCCDADKRWPRKLLHLYLQALLMTPPRL